MSHLISFNSKQLKTTNPVVEKMFNFISTPQIKKGSSLYKDLILHVQLKNLQ